MHSDTPMGRLWSEYKMETWKELLSVGRHPVGKLEPYLGGAAGDCLVRRYRLISAGRPLMTIEEHFPASYGPE